ncbi:MAG: aldo/keto reductase [Thermaerobacterales bacterium]
MTQIPVREFGPTGVKVAVIGQGGYRFGDDPQKAGQELEALRVGLDLGMTHIDTAESYGGGRSEKLIAKVLAGRRDQVFLATKVSPGNASCDGILKACEASLERLGTDHLDLYIQHAWSDTHPVTESMRGLETLADRGLVKAIGVSNFSVDQMEAAQSALRNVALSCNQMLYHLEERGIEHHLLPYCREHQIAVVAYSPLGQGSFVAPSSPGGQALAAIAERHGRTPQQVALNFVTRDEIVFTIPKAARLEHVRDNAGGAGWNLTDDDLALLDRHFPLPPPDQPLKVW